MYLSRLASLIAFALGAVGTLTEVENLSDKSVLEVEKAFEFANLAADLNLEFAPTAILDVTFQESVGSAALKIHAGVEVPRVDTIGPVSFKVVAPSSLGRGPFVIAAVDPDAPTPQHPTEAQTRHFLGGNFFAHGTVLVNNTPAISEWLQPNPSAGSDAHRYVFLMFNQPPDFDTQTAINPTTSVSGFDISDFASAVGMGNPIAGTFMLVAPDPASRRQLV